MEPTIAQITILTELLKSEEAKVLHLPYTQAFERIYTEFKRIASVDLRRHEFWELILRVRSSHTAREEPAAARPGESAGAPTPDAAPAGVGGPNAHWAGTQGSLFPDDPPASPPSDFTAAWQSDPDETLNKKRQQLLADVARSEFGDVEQKVAFILQRYPETRESYVTMCIRYWQRFNADVLERWKLMNLDFMFELDRFETIGRVRREIQNKLQLFRGLELTPQYRLLYQKNLQEYLAAHRGVIPEVRFYLDETGNEGNKAYTGVAGICTMNWRQYEMHAAALAQWRSAQGPEPIHFVEIGSERTARAMSLLKELERRRSGLLFLGYAFRTQAPTREAMFSLFAQLVVDSLHRLKLLGSLNEPRLLRVIKETEPGFDSIYLEKLNKHLTELVAFDFPSQFVVQPVETVVKGREVLLECADLIAGGMQRRALFKGQNPKDVLAEAVFNVAGFEDASDDGVVFKVYPAGA